MNTKTRLSSSRVFDLADFIEKNSGWKATPTLKGANGMWERLSTRLSSSQVSRDKWTTIDLSGFIYLSVVQA
jgi:hypothetical protein